MKQKKIGLIIVMIMIVMLLMPNSKVNAKSSGYTIQAYHITMIVNENNTFDIIEDITVNFSQSKHGITRKIPLKNTVIRNDGTKSNNRAKITDIHVSEKYTTSKQGSYKVIKIGDARKTITGRHTYTIQYKYNIGKDPLKNADELYYNLIGNQWDTSISNVTFTIRMPKAFDKTLLGFSSGNLGSTNSSNVQYSVTGNNITGKVTNTLSSGQALTVRLTLPEGYFVGASSNIDAYLFIVTIIGVIFILIAYRLWKKYGKDDEVIETVEFYPPKGYNSAEIGFLYEGSVKTKAIISLMIYLANQGYLEISEIEEEGTLHTSKSFKITKLKEYAGNNECEKLFMDGLFKNASGATTINIDEAKILMEEAKAKGENIEFKDALETLANKVKDKTSVTESDLCNHFYKTINKIEAKMNSKENEEVIYESIAKGKSKMLLIMAIAMFFLITVKPILEYAGIEILKYVLLFSIILIIVAFNVKFRTSTVVITIGYLIIVGMCFMTPIFVQEPMNLATYIVGAICMAVLLVFIKIMPKRTKYGNEMLGRIRGFKRFLEVAEKPQLEALVNENPKYFYYILPYTYALGVSDTWMNQFETITLQPPDWYTSHEKFTMHEFSHFMSTTMTSAYSAMLSSPTSSGGRSSSGGGGFSGGGSSGGGSGGGGGSSW